MAKEKQSILTDAVLEVSKRMQEMSKQMKVFSPTPLGKKRVDRNYMEKIQQEGGEQWEKHGG